MRSTLVAVKAFVDPSEAERQQIYKEALIMAQVNSAHVVKLVRIFRPVRCILRSQIGVVTKDAPMLLVMEVSQHIRALKIRCVS